MMESHRSRWARRVWVGMGALVVASLCWRESRQLQVALVRVLLHLNGDETVAKGQPPGCCIEIVPNVDFARPRCEEWQKRAGRSPDDFLLSGFRGDDLLKFPPVEAWVGHPLLGWGAIAVANGPSGWSYRTGILHETAPPERTEKVLAVVRLAQATDPENGALWLAEALAYLDAGQVEAGIQALKAAAERPVWKSGYSTAYRRARELYIERGLPYFDATFRAQAYTSVGPLCFATGRMAAHLDRLVAEAVAAPDDAQVIELLSLWADLRQVRAAAGEQFFGFRGVEREHQQMTAAMAGRLGREMPDEAGHFEARWKADRDVCAEFVRARVPAVIADAVLADKPPYWAEMLPVWRQAGERNLAALNLAILSSMSGMLALVLLAVVWGAMAVEVSFALLPRDQAGMPCYARFWFQFALGTGAALMMVYSGLHAVSGEVGLRSSDAPVEYPVRDDLLLSVLIVGVVAAARLMLFWWPWTARLGRMGLLVAYLAAVGVTTALRWRVIEALESL